MNRIRRKLVFLGISIFSLLITLTSTTYAFIVLNDEAKISEVDFEIESQDGLLLSLDGKNFYQDLSYDMIAKAIIEAQGGTYTTDTDNVLDGFALSGVSLKSAGADIDVTSGKPSFVKDTLVEGTDPKGINDVWYVHEYAEADKNSYITFDIWAKVMTNSTKEENMKDYELFFSPRTAITGEGHEVTLTNSLVAGAQEYASGEVITVNPVDAMRIAVFNHESKATTVFEPYKGLGSSAVEGGQGLNNPLENAMYTYYNSTHPLSPFTSAAEANAQFNTVEDLTSATLGAFEYTSSAKEDLNDNYEVVKLTVMIYLDGWDADYFMGINTTNLKVKLGFEIKEK